MAGAQPALVAAPLLPSGSHALTSLPIPVVVMVMVLLLATCGWRARKATPAAMQELPSILVCVCVCVCVHACMCMLCAAGEQYSADVALCSCLDVQSVAEVLQMFPSLPAWMCSWWRECYKSRTSCRRCPTTRPPCPSQQRQIHQGQHQQRAASHWAWWAWRRAASRRPLCQKPSEIGGALPRGCWELCEVSGWEVFRGRQRLGGTFFP